MEQLTITQRIPTSQFAYIEFEGKYATVEEGMADHKRVLRLYEENSGLTHKEWVAIRNRMLVDGQCDPEMLDKMSASQRWFVNELKLALRAHEPEEPIIN